MFLFLLPGWGPSRPWAWWGRLDGWAHLWAVSTPLAVSTPSTRASGLGEAASPGRRRPGCTTGRAEMGRRLHHPGSDRVEESRFPFWYGNRPSARSGKQLLTAQNGGVDSTRRGKAPPLAILSCLSHRGERHPAEQAQAGKPKTASRGSIPPTRLTPGHLPPRERRWDRPCPGDKIPIVLSFSLWYTGE